MGLASGIYFEEMKFMFEFTSINAITRSNHWNRGYLLH